MRHRTSTIAFHRTLFIAIFLASPHVFPMLSSSLITVLFAARTALVFLLPFPLRIPFHCNSSGGLLLVPQGMADAANSYFKLYLFVPGGTQTPGMLLPYPAPVCHMLLPSDAHGSSEALGLDDVKLLLPSLCQLSCVFFVFLLMSLILQILLLLLKLAYSSAALFFLSSVPPPSFDTCAPR